MTRNTEEGIKVDEGKKKEFYDITEQIKTLVMDLTQVYQFCQLLTQKRY